MDGCSCPDGDATKRDNIKASAGIVESQAVPKGVPPALKAIEEKDARVPQQHKNEPDLNQASHIIEVASQALNGLLIGFENLHRCEDNKKSAKG